MAAEAADVVDRKFATCAAAEACSVYAMEVKKAGRECKSSTYQTDYLNIDKNINTLNRRGRGLRTARRHLQAQVTTLSCSVTQLTTHFDVAETAANGAEQCRGDMARKLAQAHVLCQTLSDRVTQSDTYTATSDITRPARSYSR